MTTTEAQRAQQIEILEKLAGERRGVLRGPRAGLSAGWVIEKQAEVQALLAGAEAIRQQQSAELDQKVSAGSPTETASLTVHVCGGTQARICPKTGKAHDMSAVVRFKDGGSIAVRTAA